MPKTDRQRAMEYRARQREWKASRGLLYCRVYKIDGELVKVWALSQIAAELADTLEGSSLSAIRATLARWASCGAIPPAFKRDTSTVIRIYVKSQVDLIKRAYTLHYRKQSGASKGFTIADVDSWLSARWERV